MYSMRLRFVLGIIGIVIFLLLGFFVFLILRNSFHLSPPKNGTVTINNNKIPVEVASSQQEQEKGLSGRTSLSPNNGMIFVFNHPDFYSFWMRNMKFPLDIIYINNKKVVTIVMNAQPAPQNADPLNIPQYKPSQPADYVLEVNSGIAQKYNIKIGTPVDISL